MKEIQIFTDGACKGNPGPGGWGAILIYQGKKKEISGASDYTTNNKMELTGVIEALKRVKEPCKITITTDSKYVCDGINKKWAENWRKRGWRNAKNQYVANPELWDLLLFLIEKHDTNFVWVKGHAGHPENERCDELASKAIIN